MLKIKSHKVITVFFLLAIVSIIYVKQTNESNYNVHVKDKRVNICLNKEEFRNDIAVWTFLTDDINNYAVGAVKLLKSINNNVQKTRFDAFVLELVDKPISVILKVELLKAGWRMCKVNRIAPRDEEKTNARFRDQFTKLLLWNATEYKAHYYFDSDTLVIRNIEEYFKTHEKLDHSLHKIGCTIDLRGNSWQKTFNMGVFLIKPNQSEFNRLIKLKNDPNFAYEIIMAEQGFLNVVYRNLWYEIGFENNANLAVYKEKRDFWDGKANFINIIHYTSKKPWKCSDEYKAPCEYWKKLII